MSARLKTLSKEQFGILLDKKKGLLQNRKCGDKTKLSYAGSDDDFDYYTDSSDRLPDGDKEVKSDANTEAGN